MASSLPRFVSLGFKGKYLECVLGEGESNGLLQLSGEDVLSPKARIEVERALCSLELVHLKCCYKNKYLRRRSEKDDTIVAAAAEPDEDLSKWSCTLFRPHPQPQPQPQPEPEPESESEPVESESPLSDTYICTDFDFEIMAQHPNLEDGGGPYYLLSPTVEAETDDCYLKVRSYSSSTSEEAAFTVTNTAAVFQLPRYIMIIAENGQYLRHNQGAFPLQFEFTLDEENYMDAAVFEVVRMSDASVRLRYCFRQAQDSFLRFNGRRLELGSTATQFNDLRTRFRPLKLGNTNNSFGLRLLSNNWWCKRFTDSRGPSHGFGAETSEIEAFSVLEFEEAVTSRSINEVNYRMADRQFHDFAPVTSVTKDVVNESQTTQTGELTFTYTETKSETWSNTNSWGVGVTVSLSVRIPFIGGGDISTGAEYEGEYQWGETKETETEISTQLQVEVPPRSRVQVTMIVSRGTLVVPFSYTQRDSLYNGQLDVSQVDGGIFSGVNTYVSYETTEKPI